MNAWTTALTASTDSDRAQLPQLIVTGVTDCSHMIGHGELAVDDHAEVAGSIRHYDHKVSYISSKLCKKSCLIYGSQTWLMKVNW